MCSRWCRSRLLLELCFGLERCKGLPGDFDNRSVVLVAQLRGGLESCAHFGRNAQRCRLHSALGVDHLVKRNRVEQLRGQCQHNGDLSGYRRRGAFRLFEAGSDTPSMLDELAGIVIQASAEASEGFKLLELGVGKLEVTCPDT